jgi:arylformamidase
MKATFPFGTADLSHSHSLAIPIAFEGERLSAFGAPPPERRAYAAGDFVGDVKQGGSCNCEVYTLNPHCSGTHTECVGHITAEPIVVHEVLKEALMPATVMTVQPELQADGDQVITRGSIEQRVTGGECLEALIIRTLPNDDSKRTRNYNTGAMPPYFSAEAMETIVSLGVKHLLVDVPSIDRLDDGGKLVNHRIFWRDAPERTITELIYVPNEVKDGPYLLNLQIAPFMADVAPSRPILYELTPC